MYKKIIYMFTIIFFVSSCETVSSVKRGITGEKVVSTDEFLIQKKDPLILPPDYENLPTPDDTLTVTEEVSIFEKTLGVSIESGSAESNSTESSILKQIQSR